MILTGNALRCFAVGSAVSSLAFPVSEGFCVRKRVGDLECPCAEETKVPVYMVFTYPCSSKLRACIDVGKEIVLPAYVSHEYPLLSAREKLSFPST